MAVDTAVVVVVVASAEMVAVVVASAETETGGLVVTDVDTALPETASVVAIEGGK